MWAYDAAVRTVRRARRPDARQNAHRGSWYRCEATPPAWHPQLGFVVPLRTLACCRRRANEKSFRRYFDNDKAMFIFRTRGSHSINASVEELKPFTVKVHGDTQCASHCGLTRVPAYGRMDGWRNVMIAFSAASGGGLSKPVNPRCDTTVDEAATASAASDAPGRRLTRFEFAATIDNVIKPVLVARQWPQHRPAPWDRLRRPLARPGPIDGDSPFPQRGTQRHTAAGCSGVNSVSVSPARGRGSRHRWLLHHRYQEPSQTDPRQRDQKRWQALQKGWIFFLFPWREGVQRDHCQAL